MNDPLFFWAKTTSDGNPGISVHDHCLNVGCVAQRLICAMPERLRKLLPHGAATLAALHDVGKISPGFQQKCPAWVVLSKFPLQAAETDHAKITQWFLQQWFGPHARKIKRWLMAAGAHHGQSKGTWIKDERGGGIPLNGTAGDEPWQKAREECANQIASFFADPRHDGFLPPLNDAALGMFAGLIAVSDWIGSDDRFFSAQCETSAMLPDIRRAAAIKAVASIGLDIIPAVHSNLFSDLFRDLSKPNALQEATATLCGRPGLWIIEAPMGCGKTEAALLAASHALHSGYARGVFFGLPTQTTSNRIHKRVGKWLDNLLANNSTFRLAHGTSWLQENQTVVVSPSVMSSTREDAGENPWAAFSWFSSSRRALLSTFSVGTVDQALLGVVAAKHFFVRLFGLSGKVVILDEVHSYDLYTGTLMDLLIEQLIQLQCTVIVLSATLTRERRNQLLNSGRRAITGEETDNTEWSNSSAYPLISGVMADAKVLEFPVTQLAEPKPPIRLLCEDIPLERAAATCAQRANDGQVVLWIRNTVAGAQRSLDAVRNAMCGEGCETVLLHSRFPWFRREELEDAWLARLDKNASDRPKGAVIVATQVVEQSVDIDADFLITDLAPTDMLLQRLGRLWRHHRPDRPHIAKGPEAWINAPDFESFERMSDIKDRLKGLSPPYAAYALLRSAREWRRYANGHGIQLPDDIRNVLESTYAPWPDEPAAWSAFRAEMVKRAGQLRNKAVAASNAWALPTLPDDEGVQTRYSDYDTVTLVLLREFAQSSASMNLTGLDGTKASPHAHEWSRQAAAVLHRNHVKVPQWWLRGTTLDHPVALKKYFGSNLWALATVIGENLRLNADEEETTGLKYLPDRGVWREPHAAQAHSPDYDEFYESDD